MPRLGNARTIADLETVISAPSPGGDTASWSIHGAQCARDMHRYVGPAYSFYLEIVRIRYDAPRRRRWEAAIVKEHWTFQGARTEARLTKSLKLIQGRAADLLAWAREHREHGLKHGLAKPPGSTA